jgi:hypothetical protein
MEEIFELFRHPSNDAARCLFTTMERGTAADGNEEPVIDFIGSSVSEDRYGSIIDPRGADLASYERNPVFMWAHNYDIPPVGMSLKTTSTARLLKFKIRFAVDEFDFARTVYRLYKGGYLRGVSIGMIPKEWEDIEAKTVPGFFAENRKYTKWELLELSAAPVPANRDALMMALSDRVIAENEIRFGLEKAIFRAAPYLVGGSLMLRDTPAPAPVVEPVVETPAEPVIETPAVEPIAVEPVVETPAVVEPVETPAVVEPVVEPATETVETPAEPVSELVVEPASEPVDEAKPEVTDVQLDELRAVLREMLGASAATNADNPGNADRGDSATTYRSHIDYILGRATR